MFNISYLRGKKFGAVTIQTRQLVCLVEIFNLFYKINNKKIWVKTITPDLYHYMNYLVLAYWIMGDGAKRNKGVTLCTDGFTLSEVILLINILILKFNIQPSIHKEKKGYRIYINKIDLDTLRPFLVPHFTPHFLYKII